MAIDVAMVFPNTFPDASRWEGSRTRVLELASGLSNIGFQVALMCIKSSYYKHDIFDGILLSYMGKALPLRLHYALFPITSLFRLPSHLRSLRPKIVHFHMPTSALPKLFFPSLADDVITVYDPHDLFFLKEEFVGRLNWVPSSIAHLWDAVDIQLLRKFDAIFVTTPLMRNFVRNYVKGKIYVIPNSVDTQLFSMVGKNLRYLFHSNFVIGYMGATNQLFGFHKLVKAASVLRKFGNIKILVVGPITREAISLVECYNVRDMFYFTGHVQRIAVPVWLRTMDVGVSLLQRRSRNLEIGDFCQPIKVLEYMACGIPVIATPSAEQSRLIRQSNAGIVSKGFSTDAIIDAIIEAYNNQQNLASMGVNGRKYVIENHDWKVVVKKALRAYIDLEPSLTC